MNRITGRTLLMLAAAIVVAAGASNIDNVVPNKFSWGENVGWMNWRDANAAADGVNVGGFFLRGYIWCENVGWINVGNGAGPYANTDDTNFGVNIAPDGALSGYAWGENIGWVNFAGGALVSGDAARIDCDGRFRGFAWGENIGWINMSVVVPGQFVAVESSLIPLACDLNHDGLDNGDDVQIFVNFLLLGGADWRDVCSGDVEGLPDGMIDVGDIPNFIACLLN
ncbi:MAG: hypothetical protein L6Q92_08540 [Phycisphaerae bacterium]|nr:hypothetical protein [Phycisphaerae bacterium]